MQREEVIAKLKTAEPVLRDFGVEALYLFGSHARGEARPDSDIDVFVDPVSEDRFGFLQFMDAYATIRKTVGTDVEVGYSTREGLSPYIRANIESEAIRIF
jgi:predicted nucleotidyltransferase